MKTLKIADLFCGAGGESTGILQACKELGYDVDMLAVNHWDIAIDTHSSNHPDTKHLCESIQNVDPLKAVPGGRLDLLWASPECTHHSNARGGRPRCDQSRASAWLILKWLQELYVDRLIIENVKEFVHWGPLGVNGKPLPSKRGELFQTFLNALRAFGYRYEWRIMNAADFGVPTTRQRFILQAVRGKNKIVWPEQTHAQKNEDSFDLGLGFKPWVPAKDIIDWSIPGKSIFDRKKSLAPNTLRRIEHGIKKYWGEMAEPFLVILRGTSNSKSINDPLLTVTCSGAHYGLIEPFITRYNGGDNRNSEIGSPLPVQDCSNRYGIIEPLIVDMSRPAYGDNGRVYQSSDPLKTITCRNNTAMVEPFILPQQQGYDKLNTKGIFQPMPTITTTGSDRVVEPFIIQYYGNGEARTVENPLDTVTCKDRFAVINGITCSLDIRMRMLLPHELAAAQGFPSDYLFTGNRTEQVKQIGNAVPCGLAKAIAMAALKAA